jgi:phage replication O-like protein O
LRSCSREEIVRRNLMAKPQLEDGYTMVANEIMESLMRVQLPTNQWQVLLCIIRKTYGFKKKVDKIANFQICEATGLRKDVVSRSLHRLEAAGLITRNGKTVGFQKDWELWKLAGQPTNISLLNSQQRLTEQSTELAEQSTKVGSSHVTQKKKETIQKKKERTPAAKSLEEYKEELRGRYPDLDFDLELEKFEQYWSEGGRKLKRPKLALLNWMEKAREIKKKGGNTDGTHRGSDRSLPTTYKSPEQHREAYRQKMES